MAQNQPLGVSRKAMAYLSDMMNHKQISPSVNNAENKKQKSQCLLRIKNMTGQKLERYYVVRISERLCTPENNPEWGSYDIFLAHIPVSEDDFIGICTSEILPGGIGSAIVFGVAKARISGIDSASTTAKPVPGVCVSI